MRVWSDRRTEGFTLIEIAGAILLFALMAMPIVSMQFSMLKSAAHSYYSTCALLTLRSYFVELERDGKLVSDQAEKKAKDKEGKERHFESVSENPPFKRTADSMVFKDVSVGKIFSTARLVRLVAKPDEENAARSFSLVTFIAESPIVEKKGKAVQGDQTLRNNNPVKDAATQSTNKPGSVAHGTGIPRKTSQ